MNSSESMCQASAPDGALSGTLEGLSVKVELAGGKVISAIFEGASGKFESAILRAVEDCIVGASLREAAEHAAIYAVGRIIDLGPVSSVNGVRLPSNVSPCLARAERLIRNLYRSWKMNGSVIAEGWNFEDHGLSEAWVVRTRDDKLSNIKTLLIEYLAANALADDVLSIIDIDKLDRIDLRFGDQVSVQMKPKLLMDFERFLRVRTGERLEVFVAELKDLNSIRRL